MEFLDFSSKSSITVQFTHGYSSWYSDNKISVKGKNSNWVNGVIKCMENVINDWEPQPLWPKRIKWLMYIGFTIVIAYLFNSILSIIDLIPLRVNPIILPPDLKNPIFILLIIVKWACLLIGSFFLGTVLADKIIGLWPNVEIRTGRDFAQINKKRRNMVWKLVSVLIIPLIIAIIFEFIKI